MPGLDIVIPARGEAETLSGCLGALRQEATGLDAKVIVVANGEDRAATVAAALRFEVGFAAAGIRLVAVEEPLPGKPRAMNRGDRERRGGTVMYLDADTVLLAGSLSPLVQALANHPAPLMMSPTPRLAAPRSWLSRHWALFWKALPAVSGDVMGGGCYAVNPAGRARWEQFPDVLGDDSFVRSRFAREERKLCESGGFLQVMPEGGALIESIRRWRAANDGLKGVPPPPCPTADSQNSHPGGGVGRNLAHLVTHPRLWPYFPGFALAMALARLAPPAAGPPGAWLPDRRATVPDQAFEAAAFRVLVRGPTTIQTPGQWAEFAVAGAAPADACLLASADDAEMLEPGGLDDLLAVALRFPEAGAYVLSPRTLDPRCPFAVRAATSTSFARGPLLITAAGWRDIADLDRGALLSHLAGQGWRPVTVQTPRTLARGPER
jgi:hypothetical protein